MSLREKAFERLHDFLEVRVPFPERVCSIDVELSRHAVALDSAAGNLVRLLLRPGDHRGCDGSAVAVDDEALGVGTELEVRTGGDDIPYRRSLDGSAFTCEFARKYNRHSTYIFNGNVGLIMTRAFIVL
jgi:hypothetical protein